MVDWLHVILIGGLCIIFGYYMGYNDAKNHCIKKLNELTK